MRRCTAMNAGGRSGASRLGVSARLIHLCLMGWTIIAFVVWGTLARAQESPFSQEYFDGWVRMRVELTESRLQVAQPMQLRVLVDAPLGTRVEFPLAATAEQLPMPWGDVEVVAIDRWDALPSAVADDQRRWIRHYEIESLRTGTVMIPAIEIQYQLADDERPGGETLASQPIELVIESTLPPTADPREFRDIKGEIELADSEVSGPHPLLILAALAVVLVGAMGAVVWYRNRRWWKLDRWALREIATIRQQATSGSEVDSQTGLLRVLREYLSERYQVDARSQSNQEMLALIRERSELSEAKLQPLINFLYTSHLARFAAGITPVAAEAGCDAVRDFVLATRESPQRLRHAPEPTGEVVNV